MSKNQSEDAMELREQKDKGTSSKKDGLRGKRFIALMAFIALFICVILGVAIFKFFGKSSEQEVSKTKTSNAQNIADVFFDMDELIVNMSTSGNQKHYLKMIISLRLGSVQDKDVVAANLAVIQDSLYIFIKELRPQDFNSSGATLRFKEELIKRINKAIYPVEVKDVLFKEILVD
jgi:flagellar FliL protein